MILCFIRTFSGWLAIVSLASTLLVPQVKPVSMTLCRRTTHKHHCVWKNETLLHKFQQDRGTSTSWESLSSFFIKRERHWSIFPSNCRIALRDFTSFGNVSFFLLLFYPVREYIFAVISMVIIYSTCENLSCPVLLQLIIAEQLKIFPISFNPFKSIHSSHSSYLWNCST